MSKKEGKVIVPDDNKTYNHEAFKQFEKLFNESDLRVMACMGLLKDNNILTIIHPDIQKEFMGKKLIEQGNQLLVIARKEKENNKKQIKINPSRLKIGVIDPSKNK
jgi:hypothetical protein